jgi:hypothetical protein
VNNSPLTLSDISDARAYEREREEFRERVKSLKKRRRVQLGPIVSVLFENRETVRFQVQEMARAERLLSDEAVQAELDIYNPLIPGPGQLSATVFLELTSRAELEQWLPKLVGIERSLELVIGESPNAETVTSTPEEGHAKQLTREDVTAAVHYVRFFLSPLQVERFATEPVVLAVDHPAYSEAAGLSDETRASLLEDLLP